MAATNRIVGYLNSLDKLGISVKVYYLFPSKNDDVLNQKFNNVEVHFCWKNRPHSNLVSKTFIYFSALRKIRKCLKPGDILYTYRINNIVNILMGVNNVSYYAEITEHPDFSHESMWPIGISKRKAITLAKKLNGLFVISEKLREYYISKGVSPEKVHVINMTVDSDRFNNVHKEQTTEKYIAYCGTVSNVKDGVDELIKAFALVVKELPDIKLYIIGSLPNNKEKDNNLNLINQLGLKNNVKFTGLVPFTEMPQILKNAEVLVLNRPNFFAADYGFPTKLGEYLLTGNPVVVTKVGDIPNFIKDGVSGYLVDAGDNEKFASKIIWSIQNKEESALVGERGKELALREFNSDIETAKMIRVMRL